MTRNLQSRISLTATDCPAPLRAAVYLRVSTGRQAEGEVSIPSQRDLTTRHCLSNGWTVVDEYVEPGASATDDRRPVFQAMLERACDADHPYDVIVVHSFSRFFRDGATMELTIRKLRRHGVEVVSMTQPTGTDPSQEIMRQIIAIFDEYTSKENGKNVTRAMKENAKQGFWNGASPPLGYTIVEAERRGKRSRSTSLSRPSRPRPSGSSFASMRKVTPGPTPHRSVSSNWSNGSTAVDIGPRLAGPLASVPRTIS